MLTDSLSKYIWLADTIRRHRRITRRDLNKLWRMSALSDGKDIPRRTFYHYKQAVESLFDINIECDPVTFEYYIEQENDHQRKVMDWVLNSSATSHIISSASDVSDRIFLEDVPSAREHLSIVIEALRANNALKFDYHSYYRSRPSRDVTLEPYFVKIFKQIWYVVGRNVAENRIKTYALDRMSDVQQCNTTFKIPADFDPGAYFHDAFGIVVDKGEVRTIKIKADATQAKYLRALPLHHSQQEMVNDAYSIFTYRMRITQDLVAELLSKGSKITVLEPKELKAMMRSELKKALEYYSK